MTSVCLRHVMQLPARKKNWLSVKPVRVPETKTGKVLYPPFSMFFIRDIKDLHAVSVHVINLLIVNQKCVYKLTNLFTKKERFREIPYFVQHKKVTRHQSNL